ncbi:chromosomal replication initiator protein DnaA [bacterium]|nr:chromosomal replication initiator protein DnaA [bacterium]
MSQELWEKVKAVLETRVANQTFQTWFQPMKQLSEAQDILTIKVPNQFFYDWMRSHYGEIIQSTLAEVSGRPMRIEYSIVLEDQPSANQPEPFFEKPEQRIRPGHLESNLNEQFTFNNFVEGPNNQFAKAAAEAVVNSNDNNLYNPLLVYGGVGLGKTHLLHAIGNAYCQFNPQKRVLYISSEKFTLDFITSIRENKAGLFSLRYRKVDLLIVDDVQFFKKKERTQEEFFHTFNELHMNGKRIILSTDRPPGEIGLQKRLTSRFLAGLTVDIHSPDFETRVAILRQKSEESGIEIPYDVVEYLATNIESNIRELQGALIRLLAYSSLAKSDINLELAHKVLMDITGKMTKPIVSMEDIINQASESFGIKKDDIYGKGRKQEVVLARQSAMYLSKELTHNSLKSIGLFFGGRDHSTVIHACKNIKKKMETDDIFNAEIKAFTRRVSGPILRA